MTEWQPIETAEKSRTKEVLLWFPFGPGCSEPGCMFIGLWGYPPDDSDFYGPCWVDPNEGSPLGDPVYWMPLPDHPKRS